MDMSGRGGVMIRGNTMDTHIRLQKGVTWQCHVVGQAGMMLQYGKMVELLTELDTLHILNESFTRY